jgi:hypothetical protein
MGDPWGDMGDPDRAALERIFVLGSARRRVGLDLVV